MTCPCHDYEERAAIKEHHGGIEKCEAERQARQEMCRGCPGAMGVGLFEIKDKKCNLE